MEVYIYRIRPGTRIFAVVAHSELGAYEAENDILY